jgi:DNA-binding transcriptional ArsR family regulator
MTSLLWDVNRKEKSWSGVDLSPEIGLDTFRYENIICFFMPRAATTSDVFNALAEPNRRRILSYLAREERPVGSIVVRLGLAQPSVSKHLSVLRKVGLVHVRRHGRQMLYKTKAEAIWPLYEWASTFERLWRHQLNRIKVRAEEKAKEVDRI